MWPVLIDSQVEDVHAEDVLRRVDGPAPGEDRPFPQLQSCLVTPQTNALKRRTFVDIKKVGFVRLEALWGFQFILKPLTARYQNLFKPRFKKLRLRIVKQPGNKAFGWN
ncbi:hypothetical protein EMIT0P294_30661 [Pseudomonas sp. IT-P294]